jgi:hypothetical protein
MNDYPLTSAEQQTHKELSCAWCDASFAEDLAAKAKSKAKLLTFLDAMVAKYGPTSALLESKADTLLDDSERKLRRSLYEEALCRAEVSGQPTLSIRASFAGQLMEDFGDRAEALRVLSGGEREAVARSFDDWGLEEWQRVFADLKEGGPR